MQRLSLWNHHQTCPMNLLPLTYLGNVQYYTKLCFSPCIIDPHEHFVKQSFRNRCEIFGTNGPISLTVPVVKQPNDSKASLRDTRIDPSKRWQHRHWESIRSAYGQSPYFEFYGEYFAPFYERKYAFLFDLNLELTQLLLRLLDSDAKIVFTERYLLPEELNVGTLDFRHALSPKPRLHRPDPHFAPQPYCQVFAERFPFLPNLSMIDLLFCEGPEARNVLRNSVAGG